VFWDVSGASVHAGLFSGIDFKVESLPTLVNGRISFATPSVLGNAVRKVAVFSLYTEASKEPQGWRPQTTLPGE
jgi:paraquat-inducible protein B